MQDDNIVWYLTDGYWEDIGFARHTFNVQSGGTLTVNITALTVEGQQLARWALESWTLVTGIQFQEVSHNNANILFDDSNDSDSGAFSRPLYGNENRDGSWTISQALVNVSTNWLITEGADITDYGFTTYIHEIGHALGLGHPGDYDGSAIFAVDAKYDLDVWSFTVMSYFDQDKNTNFSRFFDKAYPTTPMMSDVLAVAELYGTDSITVNDGDTIYGYGANTGTYLDDVFQALIDADYWDVPKISMSIYDTGGTDRLDFRTDTRNQDILLGFGEDAFGEDAFALLSIYGAKGNVFVFGLIENVIAGNGNDYITGNSYGNILDGMGGDDEIYGNGGNDRIYGNWGNDSMYGGDGNDRLIGSRGNDRMEGGAGYDVFVFGPDDGYGFEIYDVVVDFTASFDMIDLSRFDSINSRDDFVQYYLYGFSQENTYLDLTPHGGGYVVLTEVGYYLGAENFIFADDAMVA